MPTNFNTRTNQRGTGSGAVSTLSQNCVLCKNRHLSFECPQPLMSKKLETSEQRDEKTNSSSANGENMFSATTSMNKWNGSPRTDHNNNSSSSQNSRNTRHRRGNDSGNMNNRPSQNQNRTTLPPPLVPSKPSFSSSYGSASKPQSYGGNRGTPSRSTRRTNPGAYGGSRSMGQEVRRSCVPSAKKMEETVRLLRPFVYGNEDMYEEQELPTPEAPKPAPVPKVAPRVPKGKMYAFETITKYNLEGEVLHTHNEAFEYDIGFANGAIVIIDSDDFIL